MKYFYTVFVFVILTGHILAQSDDSVDVTFFYYPDNNPSSVYLPGEFNGWVNNAPSSLMSYDPVNNVWFKSVRLRVGGHAQPFIPGAYEYKFYADGVWLSDPLNPRQDVNNNNNSYLFIRNPTIHLLLPNSTPASGIIRSRFPENKRIHISINFLGC